MEIDNLRIDIDRADANFNTLKASLTKYAESVNASIAGLYDAVSQASNQTLYCTGSSFGSYSYTESFTCT